MNEQNPSTGTKDLTVSKVDRLKIVKKSISSLDIPETDFGNIAQSPQFDGMD
ncbi:MAG: hypothetical protein RBR67_20305 [Desulfobacterium sp.]|jgi:hypothetical protein|nr:hypothetical protein [Desulfobacterium sp.]MDY0374497.1 hypothetical protein [Desulfobacterium sp.]